MYLKLFKATLNYRNYLTYPVTLAAVIKTSFPHYLTELRTALTNGKTFLPEQPRTVNCQDFIFYTLTSYTENKWPVS